MLTKNLIKLGVLIIGLIILSQVLSNISPLFVILIIGLIAHDKGYI